MPDTKKMSRAEAGRKGGQTTKKRYGDDFFGKISRIKKGGETTKQRYGIEFYQKIGRRADRAELGPRVVGATRLRPGASAPASRYTRVRSTAAPHFWRSRAIAHRRPQPPLLADDVVHELSQLPGPPVTSRPHLESSACRRAPSAGRRCWPTTRCVVVLAPADAEVDTASVAELLGRPGLDPVPPDRAPGLTGYLLPFVPPVALECQSTLVVDEQVADQDVGMPPPHAARRDPQGEGRRPDQGDQRGRGPHRQGRRTDRADGPGRLAGGVVLAEPRARRLGGPGRPPLGQGRPGPCPRAPWRRARPSPDRLREVREETGLEPELIGHLDVIDYWFVWAPERTRYHKFVHYFVARRRRGLLPARPRDGGRRLVRAGRGQAADVLRQRAPAARPRPRRARHPGRGRAVTGERTVTRALAAIATAALAVAAAAAGPVLAAAAQEVPRPSRSS